MCYFIKNVIKYTANQITHPHPTYNGPINVTNRYIQFFKIYFAELILFVVTTALERNFKAGSQLIRHTQAAMIDGFKHQKLIFTVNIKYVNI